MAEDKANGYEFRTETYFVGYQKGSLFLLRNFDGEFEPIDDFEELWLVQEFQDFEAAEALALEHNAAVFEVWRKDDKVVLLRWDRSPAHHGCFR